MQSTRNYTPQGCLSPEEKVEQYDTHILDVRYTINMDPYLRHNFSISRVVLYLETTTLLATCQGQFDIARKSGRKLKGEIQQPSLSDSI